jgi:general secretion pathway protein H
MRPPWAAAGLIEAVFVRNSYYRNSRGFTLIELIVILVILGLTIGMVLPRVGASWKRMEDREFLQEFVQTLKRARLRAMNSGNIVAFRIRGSERLYDLMLPPRKPIPSNVDIDADSLETDPETKDSLILFFPDGSMSGSDLEITFDQERSFHISINPLFGTVHVSKVELR